MTKFINNIVGLRGNDGRQIDIFKLHGVLFVGNIENGIWDLDKNYLRLSEHNLPISMNNFEFCDTEDDGEELEDAIIAKLL